ncbi:MAG: DNA-binding protein [Nanoarchaeota archaeon]|jgi:CspA family cold shock protein|nr:DNA-binding protein [Nanoarchaeota archaeon]|tara:strand:+ start:44857 stop:45111 length:255 start_codon:yes stop_codon:yes gene_type:complete
MKGTVKFFNESKGFGFIAGEDGTEYFVHSTGIEPGLTLQDGDAVVFDVEEGDRGPKAVNVKKDEDSQGESQEESAEESEEQAEE